MIILQGMLAAGFFLVATILLGIFVSLAVVFTVDTYRIRRGHEPLSFIKSLFFILGLTMLLNLLFWYPMLTAEHIYN